MIIRDGTFQDFGQVLDLAHEVYGNFPESLRHKPLNEAQIQRIYVLMSHSDNGFVKVVEKDGKVEGCMVGAITENHWGLQAAQDLFVMAHGGTRKLLQEFKAWAESKDADLIHVTDLCGQPGYQQVIESAGFKPLGTVLAGER